MSEVQCKTFLARFVGRGWLHATRENATEQEAIDLGLRRRWLRKELSEAHFTPKGRIALSTDHPQGGEVTELRKTK